MVDRELYSAIAVSVGAVFGVYACMTSSRDVSNAVVSVVVLLCVAAAAYFWAAWWHSYWAGRVQDMQEQINDLRMDMIDHHPSSRGDDGDDGTNRLRRVK
jgi:hypothetical protein